jgi:hypothetical protein
MPDKEEDIIDRVAARAILAGPADWETRREAAQAAWHAWNVYEDSLPSQHERTEARRRLHVAIADLVLKQALGSSAERATNIE